MDEGRSSFGAVQGTYEALGVNDHGPAPTRPLGVAAPSGRRAESHRAQPVQGWSPFRLESDPRRQLSFVFYFYFFFARAQGLIFFCRNSSTLAVPDAVVCAYLSRFWGWTGVSWGVLVLGAPRGWGLSAGGTCMWPLCGRWPLGVSVRGVEPAPARGFL